MPELVGRVFLLSLIPAITAVAGAILSTLRVPSPRARSAIQHFAAGVVFSVVSVELLPDVVRMHRPVWIVVGFTLGIGSMLFIRRFTEEKLGNSNDRQGKTFPVALVAAIGIDILVDGFLVGVGFSAGAKEGVLLVAALAFELFFTWDCHQRHTDRLGSISRQSSGHLCACRARDAAWRAGWNNCLPELSRAMRRGAFVLWSGGPFVFSHGGASRGSS